MKRRRLKILSALLAAILTLPFPYVLAKEAKTEMLPTIETEVSEEIENQKEQEILPESDKENSEGQIEEEEEEEGESEEKEESEEEALKEESESETETSEEIIAAKSEKETESESETEDNEDASPLDIPKEEPDLLDEEEEPEQLFSEEALSGGVSGGLSWDESWMIKPDFRFTKVEKEPVITEGNLDGVRVYDQRDEAGGVVGLLPYFSIAYVLEDPHDGWLYVESGDVRGFVKEDDLTDSRYASQVVKEIGEEGFLTGDPAVEKADNLAFTHTKTTVYEVLAEKEYAITLNGGGIYEYPSFSSREVGEAASGTLAYILKEADNGWLFVESDDVRGFVPADNLLSGPVAEDVVASIGEEKIATAFQILPPDENRSLYYTLKSARLSSGDLGEQIVNAALSLVGKTKYVYGGTSLSEGADCSGFTQSLFAAAGIRLPRLAEEQGVSGMEVESCSEAKQGDIFYYESGPHVGIYIGDGKIVHCSGNSSNTPDHPGRGVMVSDADYLPLTSIRRYLIEGPGTRGRGDPTCYTKEEMELIWAIVAQEDCGSYEGALAVISSAMNRAESKRWASLGSNALAQLTAPGQYCYSLDENWKSRLHGNVPDTVKKAVEDCLIKGIRNHSFTSFRSYATPGSVQIGGGNYYFN